jgi:hypothetical protein
MFCLLKSFVICLVSLPIKVNVAHFFSIVYFVQRGIFGVCG